MWDITSLTRDWAHIPCIGKWILKHWTTREVPCITIWSHWLSVSVHLTSCLAGWWPVWVQAQGPQGCGPNLSMCSVLGWITFTSSGPWEESQCVAPLLPPSWSSALSFCWFLCSKGCPRAETTGNWCVWREGGKRLEIWDHSWASADQAPHLGNRPDPLRGDISPISL